MAFARTVWKLLVAIKDGLVLILLLLFFAALYAVLSFRPMAPQVREGALLIDIDGVIVEQPQIADPLNFLLSSRVPMNEYRARDIVRAIEGAAGDERIKAVVLDLDGFLGGGQVHLSRIGAAMDEARRAGKPVLTRALLYTDDGMQLASHASEVWVDPMGGAVIAGPGGSRLYYADLLRRLNIDAHIYRVGAYKSAVEPFMRSDQSPEAAEATRALYDVVWQTWLEEVTRGRPRADVARFSAAPAQLIAAAGGDAAKAAQAAGLVDRIGDRESFGARVTQIAGSDPDMSGVPGSYAATPMSAWIAANPMATTGRPIGVITVAGEIVDGEAGPGTAGAETIVRLLNEELDEDFAALVVRIESPGGSALASERIRRAITRYRANGIPVVVSMGNVAASGGYWIATAGETIFADPATLTGSIGVFSVIPTFERALAEWGINADGVRTTPLSGQPDLLGGFTPEMNVLLQQQVQSIYDRFVGLASAARDMPRARLEPIAEGRVWAGGTARQLGLVDRFGHMEDALTFAAQRAGLSAGDYYPAYIEVTPDPFAAFFETMMRAQHIGARATAAAPHDFAGLASARGNAFAAQLAQDLEGLFARGGVQAYCLECPRPITAAQARTTAAGEPAWLAIVARLLG